MCLRGEKLRWNLFCSLWRFTLKTWLLMTSLMINPEFINSKRLTSSSCCSKSSVQQSLGINFSDWLSVSCLATKILAFNSQTISDKNLPKFYSNVSDQTAKFIQLLLLSLWLVCLQTEINKSRTVHRKKKERRQFAIHEMLFYVENFFCVSDFCSADFFHKGNWELLPPNRSEKAMKFLFCFPPCRQ